MTNVTEQQVKDMEVKFELVQRQQKEFETRLNNLRVQKGVLEQQQKALGETLLNDFGVKNPTELQEKLNKTFQEEQALLLQIEEEYSQLDQLLTQCEQALAIN